MKKRLNWRINNYIRADEVRVIDEKGEQLGVLKLEEAIKRAKDQSKDLIEIAPSAVPPVAKIIEFGKFKYQEEKKLKKQKTKTKASELKEIRFSPFIGQGDFDTRMARIKEFLDENNKVRLVVVFKGRQMGSKKFGYELLEKVVEPISNRISIDMEPKFFGRHLAMVISPNKKKAQNAKTKDEKVTEEKS